MRPRTQEHIVASLATVQDGYWEVKSVPFLLLDKQRDDNSTALSPELTGSEET
jgi:hypothetical protein